MMLNEYNMADQVVYKGKFSYEYLDDQYETICRERKFDHDELRKKCIGR